MGLPNRAATIFLSTILVVLGVIVVSLAIPLPVWRTGRLQAPPLDLVSGGQLVSQPDRLWIDTDAACGTTPRTDPDDCLAIVWLAANGPTIVALSSSYGNASADMVERTTEALVAAMGNSGLPQIPLWRGAVGSLANSGDATQPAHTALRAELLLGHGPIFRDLNFATDESAARSVLRMRLPVQVKQSGGVMQERNR